MSEWAQGQFNQPIQFPNGTLTGQFNPLYPDILKNILQTWERNIYDLYKNPRGLNLVFFSFAFVFQTTEERSEQEIGDQAIKFEI